MASKRKPEAERRKRERQHLRLRPQIDALYDELHQQYPQTFFRDFEKIHPLKIGIDHDLRERVTAPKRVLHYCMKRYTRQPAYLRALIAQKPRLDLAGQAVGTVSDEVRESAQERLSQRWERRRPKAYRSRQVGEECVTPQASPTPPEEARAASGAAKASAVAAPAPAKRARKTTPKKPAQKQRSEG